MFDLEMKDNYAIKVSAQWTSLTIIVSLSL